MFYAYQNWTTRLCQYGFACQLQAGSISGAVYALPPVTPTTRHFLPNKNSFAGSCEALV
jgi:hypothetical protein